MRKIKTKKTCENKKILKQISTLKKDVKKLKIQNEARKEGRGGAGSFQSKDVQDEIQTLPGVADKQPLDLKAQIQGMKQQLIQDQIRDLRFVCMLH